MGHAYYPGQNVSCDESTLKWMRPSSDSEMLSLTDTKTGDIAAHHCLRSLSKGTTLISELAQYKEGSFSFVGNRIFSCARFEELVTEICRKHKRHSPRCKIDLKVCSEDLRGCGSIIKLRCLQCTYVSQPFSTFEKVELDRKLWHATSKANLQFALGVLLTGLSERLAQAFLSCLDIPTPTTRNLSKYCQKVSDSVTRYNKGQLKDLRQDLKSRNVRAGLPANAKISIEADARFNVSLAAAFNQPTQPATQVVSVLVENVTPQKKIIAVGFKSKETNRRTSKAANKDESFPFGVPPGNMERDLGKKLAEDLQCDGLAVDVLTTDNDSKFFDGFSKQMHSSQAEPVKRQTCCVHTFRSLGRRLRKLRLGLLFPKDATNSVIAARSRKKFAIEFQSRLFAEYKACIEKHGNDIATVTKLLKNATEAVLACLQNNHSQCRRFSFVCRGNSRPLLWNNNKVGLVLNDESKTLCLQTVAKYFNQRILGKIRLGNTTNKCESVNATFSKTLPKGRHFENTIPGRLHLAVLCRNNGFGSGVAMACNVSGIPLQNGSPATKRMAGFQASDTQLLLKRKTPVARQRRKFCKGRRFKQHDLGGTVVETYKNNPKNYCST
ncbi:uncharacterized protein LOC143452731 [Clavelina lepadiformis]